MRYYLDTEFNESPNGDIALISLALVAESYPVDGRELYLINRDFDPSTANEWVAKNVIPHLPPRPTSWENQGESKARYLREQWFGENIKEFLKGDPAPEFWAYFAAHDWYLFCRLFGTMMSMPWNYPQLCMDLKQYALFLGCKEPLKNLVPMIGVNEHDALEDARWNRKLHIYLEVMAAERWRRGR